MKTYFVKQSDLADLGYGRFSNVYMDIKTENVFVFSTDYTKEYLLEFQQKYNNPYFPKIEKVNVIIDYDLPHDKYLQLLKSKVKNIYKMPFYTVSDYDCKWYNHNIRYEECYRGLRKTFSEYYEFPDGTIIEFDDNHYNALMEFQRFLEEKQVSWFVDFIPENVGYEDNHLIFLDVFHIEG